MNDRHAIEIRRDSGSSAIKHINARNIKTQIRCYWKNKTKKKNIRK